MVNWRHSHLAILFFIFVPGFLEKENGG